MLIGVLAMGMLPCPALAADEEVQFWLTGAITAPLAADVSGTIEVSRRLREGDDQVLVRGTADLRLSETATVGGGGAYLNAIDGLFETGEDNEFRLHQQLGLTFDGLSLRTRVEERFLEDADRAQLRIRQRIQLAASLPSRTRATISGELFYVVRSEEQGGPTGVSQWRLVAAAVHAVSPKLEISLGYQLMYTPSSGAPDRLAHVPLLTLTAKP